jgi:hypothetical protein
MFLSTVRLFPIKEIKDRKVRKCHHSFQTFFESKCLSSRRLDVDRDRSGQKSKHVTETGRKRILSNLEVEFGLE